MATGTLLPVPSICRRPKRCFHDSFRITESLPRASLALKSQTSKRKILRGFTILANAVHAVRIQAIEIADSGGRNPRNRNNATGGILPEEGVTDFEVLDCRIPSG